MTESVCRHAALLAAEREKGGHELRNVAAPTSYKGWETDLPLEPSEKNAALPTS